VPLRLVLALIAALGIAAAASAVPSSPSLSLADCGNRVVGTNPAQASNGDILYASASEPFAIRSVRADGTNRKTVLVSDRPIDDVAVSPDGRVIAFDRGDEHEVWLANRDGSDPRFFVGGNSPSFSPDGTELAIGGAETGFNRAQLEIVELHGSGAGVVVSDAAPYPEATWSKDAKTVAFVGIRQIQLEFGSIKLVGVDGSNERYLDYSIGLWPRWSPAGDVIAYTNNGDRSAPSDIRIERTDGRRERVVARFRGHDSLMPAWSVDGGALTFVVTPRAGYLEQSGELWRVDATGRGLHPISSDCRFGTGAADRLAGTARSDRILALEGDDVVDVRGGGRDTIRCGRGRDTVRADRHDVVARDCERVMRSG